jgi:hypothetical protein
LVFSQNYAFFFKHRCDQLETNMPRHYFVVIGKDSLANKSIEER